MIVKSIRNGLVRRSSGRKRFSPLVIGMAAILAVLILGVGLYEKDPLMTTLRPGETMQVHFARDYQLRPYVTVAKVAGVEIGTVSGVTRQPDGSALVDVKVDYGIRSKLGSAPGAAIRPTTLLGGNYYLDLVPGGDHRTAFTGVIPTPRTSVPVELDKVADAFQPDAVTGVRAATGQLDRTLGNGGGSALDQLLHDAPNALQPAAPVLQAAQGTLPATDLSGLVHGLESVGAVMTEQQGQLDSIVANLHTTSSVLGNRSGDLAEVVSNLPPTLESTNAGLKRLDTSLNKLRDTAGPLRPEVQQLNTLVDHTNPVLVRSLPVIRDLRGVLVDARPLVEELVPASQQGTAVLDDVRGPVIDRVNGPIKNTVLAPYKGIGPYAGSGGDGKRFYQELGYMVADVDRASKMTDANGASVGFQPGFGAGTLAGLPISLEQLWKNLANLSSPVGKEGGR